MDQKVIWEHYQAAGRARFDGSRSRLRFLARQLPAGGRVLNVGVGGGQFEEEALALGLTVSTVDPDEAALRDLERRLSGAVRTRAGSCDRLPFEAGSFDAVVMSEVLEHLPADVLDATLPEVARVLAPGGQLIGTVPANEDLDVETVVCPDCTARFHRWGHCQSFDAARLAGLLRARFAEVRVVQRYFYNSTAASVPSRVMNGLRVVLSLAGIHGAYENLYFRARRQSG